MRKAVLLATGGVNTHRGRAFSLGLLCSAADRPPANNIELNREHICAEVGDISRDLVDGN